MFSFENEASKKEIQTDYYKILGVENSASTKKITTAYHKLALLYHPDKNPDTIKTLDFQTITAAYTILRDPVKRKYYDLTNVNSATDTKLSTTTACFFSHESKQSDDKVALPAVALITGAPVTSNKIKVIFIGESGSGKVEFLKNLVAKDKINDSITTIGIDFFDHTTQDGHIFRIWDTAGQERFRSETDSNYRNASMILCFGDARLWVPNALKHFTYEENQHTYTLSYDDKKIKMAQLDDINFSNLPDGKTIGMASRGDAKIIGDNLLSTLANQIPMSKKMETNIIMNDYNKKSICCFS